MIDPDSLTDDDFRNLGFHAGLEVHHQLRSKRKLFCHCPPILEDDPTHADYVFHRYFRPVLGEMGDYDEGMLVEYEKGYKVIYFANERNTCTYEMDETPPFEPDFETIRKGFLLAFYFNCTAFADEVVVNRKQYLDGSITTGFQRTFIVARDGYVPIKSKKVRISNLNIEEDAARRVNWIDTAKRTVYFNLDRLGVPLTEVITDHRDVETPSELIETALQIGRVLRLSKIGRRGLGAVRQDVNISIKGGNRVELKGVQNIHMFDQYCRREVVRQHALIEIKDIMLERGLKESDFEHTYIDVSQIFEIKDNKTKAIATVFPKMAGLFGKEVQPHKDFGLDIFEKSMLITGLPREYYFHSDEMDDNAVRKSSRFKSVIPITKERFLKIKELLNAKDQDAFVVVMGPEKQCYHALKKVVERVKIALHGVPQETRRVTEDGNSEFLRVIHGKDRIYPDTDTPPIQIPQDKLEEWKKEVQIRPWDVYDNLNKNYNFTQKQVDLLIRDEQVDNFHSLTYDFKIDANLAFYLLIELRRAAKRRNFDISDEVIFAIAENITKGKINRNHIDQIIKEIEINPNISVNSAIDKIISNITDDEIDNAIASVLKKLNLSVLKDDQLSMKLTLPKIIANVKKLLNTPVIDGQRVSQRVKMIVEAQN